MSGVEETESSSQPEGQPVLGPVAAKGPKRFGVMPDLSKIPAGARERLARLAGDVPEWGVSAVDARIIAQSSNPDANLDVSALGSSESIPLSSAQSPQEGVSPDSSQSPDEFDDDFDPDELAFDDTPLDLGSGSLIETVESVSDSTPLAAAPLVTSEPVTPLPVSGPLIADDSPRSPAEQLPAVSVEQASSEPDSIWNDGVPLPEEPDFYADEPPFFDTDYPDTYAPQLETRTVTDSSPISGFPEPAITDLSASADEVRAQAEAHLVKLVGRADAKLREDQWLAIKALVMDHSRALVVQRTGWGKSAVYFVATALLRAQGHGPTVIISPLLALMRDQISAAERAGIRAVTINSANVTQWDEIQGQIRAGGVDVLLCSPERLNNPDFRDHVLPRLAHDTGLVVVDEAHCISDWGHDFRPDYRRIRTLLTELRPGIPVLATTATANERVSLDIAEQLSTAGDSFTDVTVLRGGLDRESLHLAVVSLPEPTQRVAWIVDALNHFPGSGIVYCMTVSAAHEVTEQLKSAGLNVAAYTGRTDPDERAALEQQLKDNEVKALIATSALGMGFDKPDLTFVIHLGAPNSPIAYYQQVGRAGRGVAQASAILLPGSEDRAIWDYFGSLAFPPEEQVREVISLLEAAQTHGHGPISIPQLESRVDLKRSRLEMMLKVLDVDGAVKRVKGGWIATGQPWTYDSERYRRVEAARVAEQNAMLHYASTNQCRIAFLRNCLDDPDLSPDFTCGRCDNCGGISLPAQVSEASLAATTAAASTPGIEVAPRKMWPTNMAALGIELSGKLSADELAEEGRAIARIDGLGWSNDLRDLFNPRTPDGETPVRLRTAAAQVLSAWPEIAHCEGVVSVRSSTRPQLVEHLATGLASYLKLPYIGAIGPVGNQEPGRHDVNSAMRLASVAGRLDLELSTAARAGLPGRSVLLIDDYTDSGWTLTVAARLLRQAGAAQVYPFVLAQY